MTEFSGLEGFDTITNLATIERGDEASPRKEDDGHSVLDKLAVRT